MLQLLMCVAMWYFADTAARRHYDCLYCTVYKL